MEQRATKKCPYCAEEILAEAVKCKHCGEYLDEKLRTARQAAVQPATAAVTERAEPTLSRPTGLQKPVKAGHVFLAILGILAAVIVIGVISNPRPTAGPDSAVSTGSALPAGPTDDADLLISRCGGPDVDDSTAYDKPRPPIPTRLIEYKKANLRFAYVPGGGAKVGDPPPYHWKFFGVVDTRTNESLTAANLKGTLERRLPCFLNNQ